MRDRSKTTTGYNTSLLRPPALAGRDYEGRAEDDRLVLHTGVSSLRPRRTGLRGTMAPGPRRNSPDNEGHGAASGHGGQQARGCAPPGGHGVPAAVNGDSEHERRSFSGVHGALRGLSGPVRGVRYGRLCPYLSGF